MASTSQTGHDKNVANIEDLTSCCIGFGTDYNPTKSAYKIPALKALKISGDKSLKDVKVTKTVYDNVTNSREIVFAPLKKLCTRAVNALESTDAVKQTIDDAKTINRKIQGTRTGKKGKNDENAIAESNPKVAETEPSAEGENQKVPEHKQISTSQQDFDSFVDNFEKLIEHLSAEPLYIPNETDLTTTALSNLLSIMKSTNTAVIEATTPYDNAMIARDILLYQPLTGLVDIALGVKKYVKSVFGATSPKYKQVSGIVFRKYKIK